MLVPIARSLDGRGEKLPGPLQTLVAKVLGHEVPSENVPAESQLAIRYLRRRLQTSYENPIALIDLARHHLALGSEKSAERAVRAAVSLAPTNRFVLRSASRFFVHKGEPDRALGLLRREGRVKSDPWLLACDIAV